jgi:hypothetical protein
MNKWCAHLNIWNGVLDNTWLPIYMHEDGKSLFNNMLSGKVYSLYKFILRSMFLYDDDYKLYKYMSSKEKNWFTKNQFFGT